MLCQIQRKRQCLSQLVVCKFAVNSLDTHYILAKAQELIDIHQSLLNISLKFANEKGNILLDFVDVDGEENELFQGINDTKVRFLEIENEINQWMAQKAEPNLIEVERKSCKYKIKWESMKIYDKRLQLKAFAAKRQAIKIGTA